LFCHLKGKLSFACEAKDQRKTIMHHLSISVTDFLHLFENTFDRKRIFFNPSPNSKPNPKAK